MKSISWFDLLFNFGRITLKFFGTLIRWVAVGFSKSFSDLWEGPKAEDSMYNADYEFATLVFGTIALIILIILLGDIKL